MLPGNVFLLIIHITQFMYGGVPFGIMYKGAGTAFSNVPKQCWYNR